MRPKTWTDEDNAYGLRTDVTLRLVGTYEVPTISETWGIEEGMQLQTLKVSGLKSVNNLLQRNAFVTVQQSHKNSYTDCDCRRELQS